MTPVRDDLKRLHQSISDIRLYANRLTERIFEKDDELREEVTELLKELKEQKEQRKRPFASSLEPPAASKRTKHRDEVETVGEPRLPIIESAPISPKFQDESQTVHAPPSRTPKNAPTARRTAETVRQPHSLDRRPNLKELKHPDEIDNPRQPKLSYVKSSRPPRKAKHQIQGETVRGPRLPTSKHPPTVKRTLRRKEEETIHEPREPPQTLNKEKRGDEDETVRRTHSLSLEPPSRASTEDSDDEIKVPPRRSRPVGIKDPSFRPPPSSGKEAVPIYSSYISATMQCFAAILDPNALEHKLGKNHVGRHAADIVPIIKTNQHDYSRRSEVDRQMKKPFPKVGYPGLIAEFLDVLRLIQTSKEYYAYAYRLLRLFGRIWDQYSGERTEDVAEWVDNILGYLATGESNDDSEEDDSKRAMINSLFRVQEYMRVKCKKCPKEEDKTAPAGAGWLLNLLASGKGPRTLQDLFRAYVTPMEAPKERINCKCPEGTPKVMAGLGLRDPPRYLLIELKRESDRGKRQRCKIRIDEDINVPIVKPKLMNGLMEIGKETYTLRAIVQYEKEPEDHGGHYLAYVRWMIDGRYQWFECDDEWVEEVDWKVVQKETEEDAQLLFFEKVPKETESTRGTWKAEELQ